jgi:uncharacterized protein
MHRGDRPGFTERSRIVPGPILPIPKALSGWRLRSSSARVFFQRVETVMQIPKEVLTILACPLCKKPLHPLPDNSGYKCEACKRLYPVRDGIPVMLIEEATLSPE